MANHTITVYGNITSPPSRAVMLLLKTLNIKYNLITINVLDREHLKPQFTKMNPLHTIPVINDNGYILYDSHAIMQYLANQYAKDDSLYPKDPKRAGLVNQRLFFNVGTLWPRIRDYIIPVMFMGQTPDVVKAQKIEEALNYLDLFLENQSWVAGKDLTIADIAIVPVVSTLEALDFDIMTFAEVSSWYERVKQTLTDYGYEEINQKGIEQFKKQLKN